MGNLCDKSIHISVLLIVLCAGVLCGLIFYIVDYVKRIEIAIVCKIEHDF